MNFKKRVNGSWTDASHYVHNTSTDTITTLPAVIYPNDTTATVGLKGNAQQNGTPTPDSPVMPQGCGERTRNLFDYATQAEDLEHHTAKQNFYLNSSGGERALTSWWISDYIEINSDTVTVCQVGGNTPAICCYDSNKEYIRGQAYMTGGAQVLDNITLNTSGAKYVRFSFYRPVSGGILMLVEGSTAPSSYIPYGYKIPISSASTTTPVYLGEVQSTRRIKKLVLTGEENIKLNGKNDTREILQAYLTLTSSGTTEATNIRCSHLDTLASGASTFSAEGIAMRANGTDMIFGFAFANIGVTVADSTAVALTKLTAYLTQQYAAGTPVTVWYVLATPTTGIVNEPIRKIGDYADTLSMEQAGVSIPTNNGSTTVDVETTLKPSGVYIKYKGR